MLIKNSIRTWLLAPFIGLFLLPLMATAVFLSLKNYMYEKENIIRQQQVITVMASENISDYLHEQSRLVTAMLHTNYLPGMTLAEKKDVLSRFQASVKDKKNMDIYNSISLLDEKGMEIVRSSRTQLVGQDQLLDMSQTPEFKVPASNGTTHFGRIVYNDVTGEPYIKISVPVKDLWTFEVKGFLVAEINLRELWQMVAVMDIGRTGIVYVTDQEGRVIVHKNRSVIHRGTYAQIPGDPTITKGLLGVSAIIAAQKVNIGDQVLVIVTELPTEEAFKSINISLVISGVFFLFMLLGSLVLGYVVVRLIVKPIEELVETAKSISNGDFSKQADPRRMDEVGELAMAFNTMTGKLVKSIKDLKQEKDFVKNVIESLSHPFYVIDVKDYTIKLANSAAKFGALHGESTCHALTHNSDTPCTGFDHPCPVAEILKTKEPVAVEHVHHVAEAEPSIIEIYGYPVFDEHGEVKQVIEYNIDVTEKRNLENQLHQSQKLESIGVLTGGVAHDFNNLLTTIIGYTQLLLMKISEDSPEHEAIEATYDAALKAAELTRQLLAFSRKQVMDMKVISLNDLVKNISRILERLIGEKVTIRTTLRDNIGNIKADPGQVEQVLMNLVVNARDAMPDGGTVYVETDTVELDEEYCRGHANISPGSYILLSVTDTGAGISPEIKEKIFDPFFTTKKKGEGTGLGLSTVYGIVSQLKGHIYVYSEQGSGTTFKIYFPEEKDSVAEKLVKPKKAIQPGTETILVVDDEESILRLVYDTLQPIGYTVLTASRAEEALNIATKQGRKIDMLLTDVIMTTMNGRELAEEIEPHQPGIVVLFMSGYTDNIIAQEGILKQGVHFLPKPLVPTVLTSKIRSLLD